MSAGSLVLMAVAAQAVAAAPLPDHAFVLTGAGRFAVMADRMSIQRDGDGVTMRAFQVAEAGFTAGADAYWGGWSRWRFDCEAQTADRLDFASVREGGVEGPTSPEPSPAYAAVPGGDAAELLAVACAADAPSPDTPSIDTPPPDAFTLEEAVKLGRAALAGEAYPPR